jgi:DNA invertase Pin-like site-specific DNA recombinase
MERELLIERTREGVAIAHARGDYKGRKVELLGLNLKYKAEIPKIKQLLEGFPKPTSQQILCVTCYSK